MSSLKPPHPLFSLCEIRGETTETNLNNSFKIADVGSVGGGPHL